jgi:predicted phosphodiesterase
MTRLAILADIHGNLPALDAVAADFAPFDIDHVIVAGDSINWGPCSSEVTERVTGAGWAVIRGNAEFYLLDYDTPRAPAAWSDRSQWAGLPWLRRELAGRAHALIAAWPDSLSLRFPDAPPLRIVHGSPRSPWEGLRPSVTDAEATVMLAGMAETTLVTGHTHLAMDRRIGAWRVLNPGSVGVPLDGLFSASYMLLDGDASGWRPTFRRVPFDYAPLFAEFEQRRFEEHWGVIGRLVVEEYRTARMRVGPFLRWRAACRPGAPLTAALLDEFARVDIWQYTPSAYHLNR